MSRNLQHWNLLPDKLRTKVVIRATTLFKLQCNNVARQDEWKCCLYYLTFTNFNHFWSRNFFFPDTASVHTYPVNSAYECTSFWIRYESGIVWMLNPDNFSSSDVARSSPVLYREYCILRWQPRRMLCCQYSQRSPEYLGDFRCVSDTCGRANSIWKTDTCGRGNFWIRKEKVVD